MNQPNSILARRTHLLQQWGLRDQPPFRGVPSGNIKELLSVFVGREQERERAILILDEGENILVRGMTGIGKTAFIMTVLYELEQQAQGLGLPILPIHIRQFAGGNREDFYRVLVYALAKRLGSRNKRAREIVSALTGEELTKGKTQNIGGGFEVGVPQIFKAHVEGGVGGETSHILKIDQPVHFLDEMLDTVQRLKYRRVIFAVDDLERVPNQTNIRLLLESCLDVIRDKRCAFILTGRQLTIWQDIYAAGLDIFNETLSLAPLAAQDLRLIAARTLNLVRHAPNEQSVFPFAEEVMATIASKSYGIPRQFVLLCGKILRISIEQGIRDLTLPTFEQSFRQLQDEWAQSDIPPDIRRILYLGLQRGGFSISKDVALDEVFAVIGISSRRQFIDFADNLVQQDLLQRFIDGRGEILYRLAPGVEKLAQSGASVET